jgi:hypothetical protein
VRGCRRSRTLSRCLPFFSSAAAGATCAPQEGPESPPNLPSGISPACARTCRSGRRSVGRTIRPKSFGAVEEASGEDEMTFLQTLAVLIAAIIVVMCVPMKMASKLLAIIALVFILGGGLLYALFHGYFDHGKFEVRQAQWSAAKQVAMVAERTDDEALGGYQRFVLIGDHLFSSADLRHAYYYDGVAFSAGSECLTVAWINARKLAVRCADRSIHSGGIAVQKSQVGSVVIVYEGIPMMKKTDR